MTKPAKRGQKRPFFIDPPGPFDTLEMWEEHLSFLKTLPADTMLKPQMIKSAKWWIAEKRREASTKATTAPAM
jgi:hypothetical protein